MATNSNRRSLRKTAERNALAAKIKVTADGKIVTSTGLTRQVSSAASGAAANQRSLNGREVTATNSRAVISDSRQPASNARSVKLEVKSQNTDAYRRPLPTADIKTDSKKEEEEEEGEEDEEEAEADSDSDTDNTDTQDDSLIEANAVSAERRALSERERVIALWAADCRRQSSVSAGERAKLTRLSVPHRLAPIFRDPTFYGLFADPFLRTADRAQIAVCHVMRSLLSLLCVC